MADSPVAEYIVEQSNGQFKVTGNVYNTAPYGIAMAKGSGLTKPVLAALKSIIANGTYKKILKKLRYREGCDRQPDDQRSDQLAQRAEADGLNRDNRSARATGAA